MRCHLSNPTKRNTECRWFEYGEVSILFSYSTPIAANNSKDHFRRSNDWGRTTGRHMREARVDLWPEVSEEEFDARLERLFVGIWVDPLVRKMVG